MTEKIKPRRRESYYHLDEARIKELVERGFKEEVFLGGEPGTAQTVKFQFDLRSHGASEVRVTVTTMVEQ